MTLARRREVAEIVKAHAPAGAADTGSPEVQVALLTARINELTPHFEAATSSDHHRPPRPGDAWSTSASACSSLP